MLKPLIAGLVIAGAGAGGVAWAHNAGEQAARHDARHACVEQVRGADPGPGERMAAMKACMTEAGFPPPTLTPEQEAKRDAARECFRNAREAHPGDRPAIREAVRACLAEAGIERPGRAFGHFRPFAGPR